jgi:hypothetical protein
MTALATFCFLHMVTKQATESVVREFYPLNAIADEMSADKNRRTNNSTEQCGPHVLKANRLVLAPCFVLAYIFDSPTKISISFGLHFLLKHDVSEAGSAFA